MRAAAVWSTVGVETVVLGLPLLLLLTRVDSILTLLLLAGMGWRRSAAWERVETRRNLRLSKIIVGWS